MTKEELRSQWRERYNEFKESGKTKALWCKENNINLKTFCNWHTKYAKQEAREKENNKPIGWLSINVKDVSANKMMSENLIVENSSIESVQINNKTSNIPSEESIILVKIGKASIEVHNGFDKNLFYDLSKILGELC